MKQKTEKNKIVVLNPPPAKKNGSIPLSRLSDVRFEVARLYREARSGKLDVQNATRLAYLLQVLAKVIEGGELEKRIEALEQAQEGKNVRSTR
ncbi:MAG: hypothetical protein PHN92_08180 [Geobacter sp.]|nr:hypothetical protein [Geobacter sp.]